MTIVMSVGVSNAFIDSYSINRDKLPDAAKEMLDEHFPKAKVSSIKIDRHLLKKTDYDVRLVNGTKIEFSNKGAWTSVDCGKKEVPSALVNKKILTYVSKNYSGSKVVSIEKKNAGYNIGLSCGKLLRFNALYQFKGEKNEADDADAVDDADNDDEA